VAVDPNGKVTVLTRALDHIPDGPLSGAGVVHYGAYSTQSVFGGTTDSEPSVALPD
jgi:hypothetical protein